MSFNEDGRTETNQRGEPRRCSYAIEVFEEIKLTALDYERGRRFTQALRDLHEAFSQMELSHGDYTTWIRRNGVVVVEPTFPIERIVVRSQPFYEYLSPNEITESAAPFLVEGLELTKPKDDEHHLKLSDAIPVKIYGPSYSDSSPESSPSIREEARIDILYHTVAIQPIDGRLKQLHI